MCAVPAAWDFIIAEKGSDEKFDMLQQLVALLHDEDAYVQRYNILFISFCIT